MNGAYVGINTAKGLSVLLSYTRGTFSELELLKEKKWHMQTF